MASTHPPTPSHGAVAASDRAQGNDPKARDKLGETRPVQSQGGVPRMPHERDESSDSQIAGEPRPLIERAKQDMDAGRVDTDRGTPVHDTYQRQKEPAAKKAGG